MKNGYELGEIAGKERCFGVYQRMEDVPTFGINVSDTEQYCRYYNEYVIPDVQKRMKETGFTASAYDSYFLSLLALVRSQIREKKHIKIVDIGGGQGENYIRLESYFGRAPIEHHVIEQEKNCEYGRKLQLSEKLHFHENIGVASGRCLNDQAVSLLGEADICVLIGALQMFSPYTDLLKEIASSEVKYIFITRVPLHCSEETFYSRYYAAPDAGEYKDVVMGDTPMAIINDKELIRNMYVLGYDIALDLLQRRRFVPMESLPSPYNEVEYRDMIFQTRKSRIL